LTHAPPTGRDPPRATSPDTLTDVNRAARFVCLQKLAYGAKIVGRTFGTDRMANRFNPDRLAAQVHAIHQRMAGVVVERLDWRAFLARYDSPQALVFLDPPYWGNEGDYGPGLFARADFEAMAAALHGLHGRFILTLNDRPEVRELFGPVADLHPVGLTYSLSGAPTQARELVITSLGLAPPGWPG
jgi:DNA adenine methylase